MTINRVILSLILTWFVPTTVIELMLSPRGFLVLVGVEGLDVARISSRPRSRIGTVSYSEVMIQPTHRGHNHNLIRAILPISTPLKCTATKRQERTRYRTRLCNKQSDDDEDSTTNSGGAGDDIDDKNSPMDPAVTTDEAAATMMDRRQNSNPLSDFLYGANYVHSQYLSIVWRYSILRSFAVTLPIGIILWMNQEHGLYESLFRVLRSVLAMSSVAARLLQLPLEFAQSLLLNIWNVSPEAVTTAIDFLPNAAAIPLVQLLLAMRATVTSVVEGCCGNSAITFLSSMAAILVWRPAVEEWQYRSVIDKLLFGAPRWILARGRELSPSTIAIKQRITSIGTNRSGTIGMANNATSSSAVQEVMGDTTLKNEFEAIDEKNSNSTSTTVAPAKSKRILLRSLLFATTRLRRITSVGRNRTGTIEIANNETSSSTVQVANNHSSLSDKPVAMDEKNDDNVSSISVAPSDEVEEGAYIPFLPAESTRILLGSLLFATTRLGWLSTDPFDTVALSNSPYGFTIGFLQSIWSLVSSGGGVSEVRHGLRIFVLLLAIHQSVSSFLVAQHVFAGIYRQKGLAASVGAHVSWTVGKGTILFRLMWKFWQSTTVSVWSASYGSKPDTGSGADDDSTPSRGDEDDE